MNSSHINTPFDGRGARQAYLNGAPINRVVYADTHKGKARIYDDPPKLGKYRKRIIERTLYGAVTVEPLSDL